MGEEKKICLENLIMYLPGEPKGAQHQKAPQEPHLLASQTLPWSKLGYLYGACKAPVSGFVNAHNIP